MGAVAFVMAPVLCPPMADLLPTFKGALQQRALTTALREISHNVNLLRRAVGNTTHLVVSVRQLHLWLHSISGSPGEHKFWSEVWGSPFAKLHFRPRNMTIIPLSARRTCSWN